MVVLVFIDVIIIDGFAGGFTIGVFTIVCIGCAEDIIVFVTSSDVNVIVVFSSTSISHC